MIKVKVGQILNRVKETLIIQDEQEYKRLTIRMYHKGVCLRDTEMGANIGTKNQFVARSGQFIMSRIDARNGAFGIIPESIGQGAITNDFLSFTVNEDLVSIKFFKLYSQTDSFMQLCIEGSKGTTNRKRLKEEFFLEFEVFLPDIESQGQIVSQISKLQTFNEILDSELHFQNKSIQNLRQSILQEAVQGKLVSQDTNDEPVSVLLAKIRAEKELLIKEKKIKKEKPLPEISEEEIPYGLPNGWELVRLQDITSIITCGYASTPNYVEKGKTFLSAKNVKPYKFMPEDHKFISEEDYHKLTQNAKPEVNDILLTRVGAGIGEAAIVDKEFDFAIYVSLTLIKPFKNHIDSKYLLHWINSPEGVGKALKNTYGVGVSQGNLNVNQVRKYVIPLPPYSEQKRIVEKVDKLMILCDNLEKTVVQSRQESELLMRSILKEAFQFA
ncbi:restriction endonuclease subunit S [Desulfosporosinus sp. HMP52]|uniref:restriction endonuclease subunit S n=1 Tax=Desulfosporosinus sp. HMP52 TaxID=1487923 RepID=UPI00068ADF92|nr:restriction endonuclease subunit S [Desulfosporosinus sp. HMP52]